MEQKKLRMQELVELLNRASKAYYQEATEIMSNYEYDKLYDELLELEKELGITMANSPTVNVGYEVLSELPKERREKPMLSLDKTKEISLEKESLRKQQTLIICIGILVALILISVILSPPPYGHLPF